MTERAEKLDFEIDGLSCAGCVRRAETALLAVDGVVAAQVALTTHRARVEIMPGADIGARVQSALRAAGYPAVAPRVRLAVSGMTCGGCAAKVTRLLEGLPGVIDAQVNFANGTAQLRTLYRDPTPILAALDQAGYPAEVVEGMPQRRDDDSVIAALRHRFFMALMLALPVVVLAMGAHMVPGLRRAIEATLGQVGNWSVQAVLTTLVLIGPGREFYTKGAQALRRLAPDMNSLVMLGTGAAWGYSMIALVWPQILPDGARHVYFEAAAVIVTLILLGRWLEARAKGQTGAAIRALLDLTPDLAQVDRDGAFVEVPVAELVRGDIVLVQPGGRVPVDGVVRDGESFVDESMITGEPIPVEKHKGDALTGGTLNGAGPLRMRVTDIGSETVLARIVAMVEEAQSAQLPVQDLINRITVVFVPVIMAIAVVTVLAWMIWGPGPSHALVAGVAVLIIACPCAMGLAVPVSIMVGTGRGAQLGVLFRQGDALQRLSDVQVVGFDKTGTLTRGTPSLHEITVLSGDEETILAAAAAVEALSEHPLARAIIALAKERDLTLPEARAARALPGLGIVGEAAGRRVAIGSARLMEAEGVETAALQAAAEQVAARGATPVMVALEGQPAAVFGLFDAPRETAKDAVQALHQVGVRTAVVSGDVAPAVQAVADQLGIDHVVAGVLPEGKVEAIRALQAQGVVAFVGDGINDAPALAAADVGVAIGSGTDVAIESADVVLMSGDPMAVARAVSLSRATMRNIKQNLGWAFGYNILLVPVAAGVLYPVTGWLLSPGLAAGAMALSSVLVLSNALRLRNQG